MWWTLTRRCFVQSPWWSPTTLWLPRLVYILVASSVPVHWPSRLLPLIDFVLNNCHLNTTMTTAWGLSSRFSLLPAISRYHKHYSVSLWIVNSIGDVYFLYLYITLCSWLCFKVTTCFDYYVYSEKLLLVAVAEVSRWGWGCVDAAVDYRRQLAEVSQSRLATFPRHHIGSVSRRQTANSRLRHPQRCCQGDLLQNKSSVHKFLCGEDSTGYLQVFVFFVSELINQITETLNCYSIHL